MTSGRGTTVQSLWLGTLSTLERLSMASFLAHGHAYHLYTYDLVPNVPPGVVLKDANEIIPGSWIFRDDRDSHTTFSEFFRYKLLLDRGGWWVDTDLVAVRPLDLDGEYVFCVEPDETVGTAAMRAPAGAPIMRRAWEACCEIDRGAAVPWSAAGPRLLIRLVDEEGLSGSRVDPVVFFPFDWSEWERAFETRFDGVFDERTRTVHFWNSMWALAGRSKEAAYPSDCLYEWLKRRYLRV
jgi:hypothetical protein